MRILVVDPDPRVRRALRRAFELEGHRVDAARDGREALDRILVGVEPDVLVLDTRLPRVDGLEVCKHIRRSGRPLPILLLTTSDEREARAAASKADASAYLPKPFALEELLARIGSLVRE